MGITNRKIDMSTQSQTVSLNFEGIEHNTLGFHNPRRNLGDISELKESIKTLGLLNAPIVYAVPVGENNEPLPEGSEVTDETPYRFVLICGHRRMEAVRQIREEAKAAGAEVPFEEVQATIYQGDLAGALAIAIQDNDKRDDLNMADLAESVLALSRLNLTQNQVAERLNRSQPWVSGMLRIATLCIPEVLEALRNGRITKDHAKAFSQMLKGAPDAQVPDVEMQLSKLESLLAPKQDKRDASLEPKEPKERTTKSKEQVLAMRKRLAQAEGVDPLHRQSVQNAFRWIFGELSDDDLLTRQPAVDEPLTAREAREKERAEKEAAKAAKIAAKVAEKAATAAAKEAAKAAANGDKKAPKRKLPGTDTAAEATNAATAAAPEVAAEQPVAA